MRLRLDYRVEHGADRVGRGRPSTIDTGIANVVPASEKSRAVRLKLQFADGFAFHNEHMRGPNSSLLFGSFAARCKKRADIRDKFGLHKQVGESRMGHVGRLGGEAKLGVGSELNIPRAHAQSW